MINAFLCVYSVRHLTQNVLCEEFVLERSAEKVCFNNLGILSS